MEKLVAARMERRELLSRENPPLVIAVMDESALRRRDAIMGEQLAHLVRTAELPHVHLHLIPTDAGLHVGLNGNFSLARGADGGWVGNVAHNLADHVVNDEENIALLLVRWEGVRSVALSRNQSLALLKEIENQHGPQ